MSWSRTFLPPLDIRPFPYHVHPQGQGTYSTTSPSVLPILEGRLTRPPVAGPHHHRFSASHHRHPLPQLPVVLAPTTHHSLHSVQEPPLGIYSMGVYLLAEVDGGFGKDVLEFLVKGDVFGYRSMATKVTNVYPFTTALGDSKGQEERLKKIIDRLGWNAPSFDSMD